MERLTKDVYFRVLCPCLKGNAICTSTAEGAWLAGPRRAFALDSLSSLFEVYCFPLCLSLPVRPCASHGPPILFIRMHIPM